MLVDKGNGARDTSSNMKGKGSLFERRWVRTIAYSLFCMVLFIGIWKLANKMKASGQAGTTGTTPSLSTSSTTSTTSYTVTQSADETSVHPGDTIKYTITVQKK